jgi:hypothetical protein
LGFDARWRLLDRLGEAEAELRGEAGNGAGLRVGERGALQLRRPRVEQLLTGRCSVSHERRVPLTGGGGCLFGLRPELRRRLLLELNLRLPRSLCYVVDAHEDTAMLWEAVLELRLEGIVGTRTTEPYRAGQRAWIRRKSPLCRAAKKNENSRGGGADGRRSPSRKRTSALDAPPPLRLTT